MNILIDAQLPPALASLLTDIGHQAHHDLALQRWLMPLLSEIERLVAAGEALIEVR